MTLIPCVTLKLFSKLRSVYQQTGFKRRPYFTCQIPARERLVSRSPPRIQHPMLSNCIVRIAGHIEHSLLASAGSCAFRAQTRRPSFERLLFAEARLLAGVRRLQK